MQILILAFLIDVILIVCLLYYVGYIHIAVNDTQISQQLCVHDMLV